MDYDGKRDRWNGYDPEEHQRIVEEYAKVDLVSSSVVNSVWLTSGALGCWEEEKHCLLIVLSSCSPLHESDFAFVSVSQAKRTLKAQKLQDELASGKLDQTVSVR